MQNEEDLKALFEDTGIPEEAINKLSENFSNYLETIYEKADEYTRIEVENALEEQKEKLEESHKEEIESICEKAEEYAEYTKGEIVENVQGYVDHIMSDFIKENEDRFKQLEDYARMKESFDMIKEAFESNGFQLNEEAPISNLQKELSESQDSYNELFSEHLDLKNELSEMKKIVVYENKTKDLTETQKQKLNNIILKMDLDENDIDSFSDKLESLIENLNEEYNDKENLFESLNESNKDESFQNVDDRMKRYLEKL